MVLSDISKSYTQKLNEIAKRGSETLQKLEGEDTTKTYTKKLDELAKKASDSLGKAQ